MHNQHIFNFKTDLTEINIPTKLNNPFAGTIPKIAQIAASEFQAFIEKEAIKWQHDFDSDKGKMFGVLVIRDDNGRYFYIGTVSGKLFGKSKCAQFVPSVFQQDKNDTFFDSGMTELTSMSAAIKNESNTQQKEDLKEQRRLKSVALQHKLFEQYLFKDIQGNERNVIEIFKSSKQGYPPSAAGECAAPKLLNYAFQHDIKPIAIAEFWWGKQPKNKERKHKQLYPACKNKCRPILEFMLNDLSLYNQRQTSN